MKMNLPVVAIALAVLFLPMTALEGEGGGGGTDHSLAQVIEVQIDFRTEQHIVDGISTTRVVIKDGGIMRAEGGWCVPFLVPELPFSGEVEDVEVDFYEGVPLSIGCSPWTVPGPLGSDSTIDPEWSSGQAFIRSEGFEIVRAGGSDGCSGAPAIRLYPVRFEADGTSILHTKAMITLRTTMVPTAFTSTMSDRKPFGPIKYLIITDEDLVDELEPLAVWKSQKGLFARIVTTSEIDAMYEGKDLPKKMRSYVMDMENAYDLDYLLLAGDHDKVPTRAAYNDYPYSMYGEPGYYATDMYFACVDNGTTWNTDGDGNIGEPTDIDDAVPDMAIGRLAINDGNTLNGIVSELIDRDMDPVHTSDMELPVFMTGDPVNNPGDPIETMDDFWDSYGSDIFTDRITMNYDGTGSMSFSSTSVNTVLDDRHQFLGYFSHGQTTSIPNLYDRSDVQSLSGNGQAGAFFAMACLTGWFDKPIGGMMYFQGDCLGEVLTETPTKGVAGYIGSSRLAVGEIDTTYSGDAPGLEEDYWRGVREAVLGNIPGTTGDIHRYAVTRFSTNFYPFPGGLYDGSLRTFLEYNLLGEPDATLSISDPIELHLEFALAAQSDRVDATVTDGGGLPVEGATVAICRYGEVGRSATTGQDGKVSIPIPDSNGGNVTITAYRRGDVPAQGNFTLDDELPPALSYEVTPSTPDGNNGYYRTSPVVTIDSDEPATIEYSMDGGAVLLLDAPAVIAIEDGEQLLEFGARDLAGHTSEVANLTLVVDTVPPDISVVSDPELPDGEGGFFRTVVNISLGSAEEVSNPEYRINGGIWKDYLGPIQLGDGSHEVLLRAKDAAGNTGTTMATFKIDASAPISSIMVTHLPDGDNGYYITTPHIELRAIDDNTPTIEYRWDSEPWTPYFAPFQAPEGIHLLGYRATDGPGNVESTRSQEFKVDTVTPVMTVHVTPSLPDGLNGFHTVNPVVNATADEGTIRYALVPEGIEPSWTLHGREMTEEIIVGEGNWTLLLICADDAGNFVQSGPYPLSVDSIAPRLTYDISPDAPDGDNGWYRSYPSVKVRSDDGSRIAYRLHGSEGWVEYTGPIYLEVDEAIVEMRAIDHAGNTGSNSTGTIRCEGETPWVTIKWEEGHLVAGSGLRDLVWEGGDNIPGSARFEIFIDGGPFRDIGWNLSHPIGGLEDGAHHATVRGKDLAGNTASATVGFRVDATYPKAIAHSPTGSLVDIYDPITVLFSEDMDRDSVNITMGDVQGRLLWDIRNAIFDPIGPLDHGTTYTVTVRGNDRNGLPMETLIWNFTTIPAPESPKQKNDAEVPWVPVLGGFGAILLVALVAISFVILRMRRSEDLEEFELME